MLPPPTCNSDCPTPAEVRESADQKLLMTSPSHEPEEHRPQKPIRIVLPREVCTTPAETAKLL